MSISQNFPEEGPTLNLNFAGSRTLDPRITFTRTQTTSNGSTYMGRDGLIKYAGADEPRFDHRYVNGEIESLGLLIEEQRTNYILNSNNVDANGKQNITTSLETIIDPTGFFSSVRKIQITGDAPSPTTYSARWGNTTSGDNTSPYSGSVWARSESGTVDIEIDINDSTRNSFTLDETWSRISVSRDSRTEPYQFFDIRVNDGQAGSSFYVWGLQIEKGAFPTSYIPTEGSTKTRTADKASITGSNFTEWYNPSEGTVYTQFKCDNWNVSNSFGKVFTINEGIFGVENNGFWIGNDANTSNSVRYRVRTSGTNQFGPANLIRTSNIVKSALSVKTSDFAVTINGNTPTTSTSGTLSTSMTNMTIGRDIIGIDNLFLNGTIAQLTYYPQRLPNSQLVSLTR